MKKSSPLATSDATSQDYMVILKKIGERVRFLRKQKQPNYQEFAKLHGINKVTLLRIEAGQKTYSIKNLLIILNALEISPVDFFKSLDEKHC